MKIRRHKKSRLPITQIYVGAFPLGFISVDLYALTNDSGGCFYTNPDNQSAPRIKVGIQRPHWPSVVEVLLHEALELAMAINRLRLERSGVAGDSSSYLFVFDHTQFVDLCDCAASFITPAMPALQAIHHKHHLPLILNQK